MCRCARRSRARRGGSGGQEPDEAGEGARIIADVFLKAELPVPLPLAIPAGKDGTDFLKEGRTAWAGPGVVYPQSGRRAFAQRL